MPRPKKRSRVASSRVAAKESLPPAAAPVAPVTTSRSAQLNRNSQNGPSSDIYDVSDREKEIRERAAGLKPSEGEGGEEVQQKQQKMEENGATGPERRTRRLDTHANPRQKRELAHAQGGRNEALRGTREVSPSSSLNAETPPIELGRRSGNGAGTRGARATDVSGLDLDDDIFGGLDDSLGMDLGIDDSVEGQEAGEGDATTQTGQRSMDTSSFNVALFKRRPRASSVAGRDDAPIRPSSRGPNTPSVSSTLNLGLFRRRAREPSILGTAQKDRSARAQSHVSASENEGGAPAGESFDVDGADTPLDRGRRQSTRRSASSKHAAAGESKDASPSRPHRKRKSLEKHDGREKRPALESNQDGERDADEKEEREEDEVAEHQEAIQQSIEVDDSDNSTDISIPSLLRRGPSNRPRTPPQQDDADMAPPASSSSDDSPTMWPPLQALAHHTYRHSRRSASRVNKTPELLADDGSVMSSPPSLTHSPDYAAPKSRAAKGKTRAATRQPSPKVTTTADLASLLPQRRHRPRRGRGRDDPYELGDSEDGSEARRASVDSDSDSDGDSDELSYHVSSRAATRARNARPLGSSTNKGGKKTPAARKAPTTPASAGAGTEKRAYRTYGSARDNKNNSDKENESAAEEITVGGGDGDENEDEGQEDETAGETGQEQEAEEYGEEIVKAIAKFKEVDRWELEFEEVAGNSSPRDAR